MSGGGNSTMVKWSIFFSVSALCVAVATSLIVILFIIQHNRELAARDLAHAEALGRTSTLAETAPAMATEIDGIRSWMIAVYERLGALGLDPPPLPKEKTQ